MKVGTQLLQVLPVLLLGACAGCAERRIERTVLSRNSSSALASPGARDASLPSVAPQSTDDAGATFLLPIPARAQSTESPPAGWCGETAIQEGLLHLGMWAPQRHINRAGRPVHPDLYANDIPMALNELGIRHTFYAGGRGYGGFARWVKAGLEAGEPVIAGVKILPTAHPDWGLDHFVLAVGHGPKGLLVNTTWGHREWVGDTTTPGLSLANAFFGIRLHGQKLPAHALPARVTLLEEGPNGVTLRVKCVERGGARIERHGDRFAEKPLWVETRDVGLDDGVATIDTIVPADHVARFACIPLQLRTF